MKKYITVFKTSWQNILTYRFNFFMGRLRSIILLLLLYYIWMSLSFKTGNFAGYSSLELTTYVFLATIIKSVVMGSQTRKVAEEINDGTFSKYLCAPVNYPLFVFSRELAEKSLYFISSIFEIMIFAFFLKAKFFVQTDYKVLLGFIMSVILAIILYFIFAFCVSLWAFWSREAMGPRFLFEWFLEFTAGVFYPIDILFSSLFLFLTFLPFAYIIFYPIMIYLGRVSGIGICRVIAFQIFWILISIVFTIFIWKKGLRKYSGEGM